MLDFSNLTDLLSRSGTPAWWQCPIQQGIPVLLDLAATLLLWFAGFAFLIGILISVFNYMTSFGDESKAKKGKESLKWTLIGSVVVILSSILISAISESLLAPSDGTSTNILRDNGIVIQSGDERLGRNSACFPEKSNPTSTSGEIE